MPCPDCTCAGAAAVCVPASAGALAGLAGSRRLRALRLPRRMLLLAWLLKAALPGNGAEGALLRGQVVAERTGRPLPSRVYINGEDGKWYFPRPAAAEGSAVRYEKRNWANTNAVEMHTTLSAHPFEIELPPGRYTVTVERGKEYVAQARRVELRQEPVDLKFELHRWIDMAERGWYSGDTHVHRALDELPNLMLAEDLNVSFPLLYWVTEAFQPPAASDRSARGPAPSDAVKVDDTHVIIPRNTEYEIFTVSGQRHTLGAVFVLNHKSVFEQGAPPVGPVAAQAHREGALLDLDKHDWPWSMALVPVMGVDLYELANNHVWRTEFAFTNWSTPAPAYMALPNQGQGGTELDWVVYGLENYYALLNCGFRLRPTAGTANGVHPVPLGFSRVYVYLEKGFSADGWIKGLGEGRSFVTTGPMLMTTVNKAPPGQVFRQDSKPQTYRVDGVAIHERPLDKIEIIVNGEVAAAINPRNKLTPAGAYESKFAEALRLEQSCWVAARCFEPPAAGKARFAHTGPWHVEVAGKPLLPKRAEAEFLVQRVADQIQRSAGVLPAAAIAEYRQALAVFQDIANKAR